MKPSPAAMERFESFVERITESGCWLWTGSLNPCGYGSFWINGKLRGAHRAAYELLKGDIPEGKEIDHLCRVRCCVNPDHLEPVTHAENMRRGSLFLTRITHCHNGHEYTESNTQPLKNGWRLCRICARANRKKAWAKQKMKKALATWEGEE